MSSLKQIVANRRNALKSTGPTTPEGKQHARCNAVRHGLTAETVIGVLEDANDYAAFEAAVTADYDAEISSRARTCASFSERIVAPTPRNRNRNRPFQLRDLSQVFVESSWELSGRPGKRAGNALWG